MSLRHGSCASRGYFENKLERKPANLTATGAFRNLFNVERHWFGKPLGDAAISWKHGETDKHRRAEFVLR